MKFGKPYTRTISIFLIKFQCTITLANLLSLYIYFSVFNYNCINLLALKYVIKCTTESTAVARTNIFSSLASSTRQGNRLAFTTVSDARPENNNNGFFTNNII